MHLSTKLESIAVVGEKGGALTALNSTYEWGDSDVCMVHHGASVI